MKLLAKANSTRPAVGGSAPKLAEMWAKRSPLAAILVALLPASALAAPRPVAMVNLARDQQAGQVAVAKLRNALAGQPELTPVASGDLSRALERPLARLGPMERDLERAKRSFVDARKAEAMFSYAAALRKLAEAETILLGLPPTPQITGLLAEANFRAGLIYAIDKKKALALRSFRTVRTLAPARRALDPGRYAPSVVALYAQAANAPIGNAQTKVTTTYDGAMIHLDGRKIGRAPITIALSPGVHYVVATFKGHKPSGVRLLLASGASPQTRLRLQALRVDEKARLLRRRSLATANLGYLDVGRRVARLAKVDAVIIVSGDGTMISSALYDTRSDLLGKWRRFGNTHIDTILAPLLPLPRIVFPDPIFIVPGPVKVKRKWHEKLWVRVSGGVAAVVATVMAVSIGFDTTTPMVLPEWL